MNELLRAILIGGIILTLFAPGIFFAAQRLGATDTLPRPRWTQPAPSTITVRPNPAARSCTCLIYDHTHEQGGWCF